MNGIFPFNVLSLANQIIGQSTIKHVRYRGNAPDDAGQDVPMYFTPVNRAANVQPMPRDMIEKQGFDVQKTYLVIYTEADLCVADLERGRAPDMVDFGCDRYTVESNTPWVDQNGWKGSVCVKTGPAP